MIQRLWIQTPLGVIFDEIYFVLCNFRSVRWSDRTAYREKSNVTYYTFCPLLICTCTWSPFHLRPKAPNQFFFFCQFLFWIFIPLWPFCTYTWGSLPPGAQCSPPLFIPSVFFTKMLEDMSPFCGPLIPLFWTSVLGFKARMDSSLVCFLTCVQWIPQIHIWYDTCWLLDSQHDSCLYAPHSRGRMLVLDRETFHTVTRRAIHFFCQFIFCFLFRCDLHALAVSPLSILMWPLTWEYPSLFIPLYYSAFCFAGWSP